MSPPAGVVWANSSDGWSWVNTNTTTPATTDAVTMVSSDGRRRGASMDAPSCIMRPAYGGRRSDAGGATRHETEDAAEPDGLAVAVPPARLALGARVHGHLGGTHLETNADHATFL